MCAAVVAVQSEKDHLCKVYGRDIRKEWSDEDREKMVAQVALGVSELRVCALKCPPKDSNLQPSD